VIAVELECGDAGVDDTACNAGSGVAVDETSSVSTPAQVVYVLVYLQHTAKL